MALDYHSINAATGRGLAQATTDIVSGTEKKDVSDMLDLLALAETPFVNRIGWGAETGGVKIEWISEDLGPGYVVAGSVKASAGTSLQIATVEGLTTAEAARQIQTGTVLYHYSADGEHGPLLKFFRLPFRSLVQCPLRQAISSISLGLLRTRLRFPVPATGAPAL